MEDLCHENDLHFALLLAKRSLPVTATGHCGPVALGNHQGRQCAGTHILQEYR